MPTRFIKIFLLTLPIALWTKVASPQLVPIKGLAPYSEYRKEILKLGWIPKPSLIPDYVPGWPEIICGNRVCSATFISPNGKELLDITVWFDIKPGQTDYYIAPAFDIVDCTLQSTIEHCK